VRSSAFSWDHFNYLAVYRFITIVFTDNVNKASKRKGLGTGSAGVVERISRGKRYGGGCGGFLAFLALALNINILIFAEVIWRKLVMRIRNLFCLQ